MSNAYIYRKLIGEHWFVRNENPMTFEESDLYLDSKIKSIPDGKSFIFFTDAHCKGCNAMNSPAIIGYIRELSNAKKVIFGGDVLHREDNKYLGAEELLKFTNVMRSVAGQDYLYVFGNHDLNSANAPLDDVDTYRIEYQVLEKILFDRSGDRVTEDISEKIKYLDCTDEERKEILAFSRLHYYVDDDASKVRYIILEPGNQKENGRNGCIRNYFDVYNNSDLVMQYDWLYDTLLSTPEDYDVVVSGHAMLGYGGCKDILPGPLGVCKIISGFKTCSKVSVENPFPYYDNLAKYYAKGEHIYDFTSRKAKTNVVVIAGDVHSDAQTKAYYDENGNFVSATYQGEALPDTAVVVNTVLTDAYVCSKNYHNAGNPEMIKGTITEQAIDVVTFCENGIINFTRIGAGDDRKIIYK